MMDNYCRYCNKTLSDFEMQHNALHNPDKQLCRPCLVYRQPDPVIREPLTDEQKAANAEDITARINRLLAIAMEQNK